MNRFVEKLSRHCAESPLQEKWILAPTLRTGHQWLERVSRAGRSVVNARVMTVRSLAVLLALPAMAARGETMASPLAGRFYIDKALGRFKDGGLPYLGGFRKGTSLAAAVLSSINSIRLAGLKTDQLVHGAFDDSRKGIDLAAVAGEYLRLLEGNGLLDYAGVLQRAIERATSFKASSGERQILAPEDLEMETLEENLLHALPECTFLQTDRPAGKGEGRDNVTTNLERLWWLEDQASAPPPLPDETVLLRSAVGEENEIRMVLRSCLARGVPLGDVELLHSDTALYLPVIYEVFLAVERSEGDEDIVPPVTFAEGLPCDYSRPGRALKSWLRWIDQGFPASGMVAMLREGLLKIPEGQEGRVSFHRLAELLRGVGIGFGQKQRYLSKLDESRQRLERRLKDPPILQEGKPEAYRFLEMKTKKDIKEIIMIRNIVDKLHKQLPPLGSPPAELLSLVRTFLEESARSINQFDNFVVVKFMEELAEMDDCLEKAGGETGIDIREWLEELSGKTRVLGSGPRPGRLHVDHLSRGGHSGRHHTFIVGLDDGRFPGSGLQDPLILDGERERLSAKLPTAAAARETALENFSRLLARLRGKVLFSFPCQSVTEDRELFPSTVMLKLFRLTSGITGGDQADLLKWLPPPASFAPDVEEECLDGNEWWLWRLTGRAIVENAGELVNSRYPHLSHGWRAAEMRLGSSFTGFDGSVPEAGRELDPRSPSGPVLSANALQTAGVCPLRFFFRYGLDIMPPEEVTVDPTRWLDPLARGKLLHELFEQIVRERTRSGKLPGQEAVRSIVEERAAAWRERYPPPGESAFEREKAELVLVCETFYLEEERSIADGRSVPVFLEASIGMASEGRETALDRRQPVKVHLPGGGSIRLKGRIDRIDRENGKEGKEWSIWDYKTGGTGGYRRDDPHREGRTLQPYLYMKMVSAALSESASFEGSVGSSGFFFPGVRAAGDRLRWSQEKLEERGGFILEGICRTIGAGAFIATSEDQDCRFCDYAHICGDLKKLNESVAGKLAADGAERLNPFRDVRGISLSPGGEESR